MRESLKRGALVSHGSRCLAWLRGGEFEQIIEIFVEIGTIAMLPECQLAPMLGVGPFGAL